MGASRRPRIMTHCFESECICEMLQDGVTWDRSSCPMGGHRFIGDVQRSGFEASRPCAAVQIAISRAPGAGRAGRQGFHGDPKRDRGVSAADLLRQMLPCCAQAMIERGTTRIRGRNSDSNGVRFSGDCHLPRAASATALSPCAGECLVVGKGRNHTPAIQ